MNLLLRIFAGVIDFLQLMFFLAFFALQLSTPIGGAATGAVGGAIACYNASSGFFSSVANAATCFAAGGVTGFGLSALAVPIGMAVGVAISCTFGVVLIALLCVSGRFSLMALILGVTGELIPGVNAFMPGWSILVGRSIAEYKKKTRRTPVPAQKPVRNTAPPVPARPIDGVRAPRAANDNQPYATAA